MNEYNEKKETGFGTATAKLEAENKIFRAEQNIKDQKKAWMDLISETKAYEQSISIISKKIKVDDLYPQPEEGTYDYWQQQVQIADVALKQIKDEYMDILKGGNAQEISVKVPDDVVQQYNVLVKQKKVAEEKLKIYDDNSSKQESAAEKLRKEQSCALLCRCTPWTSRVRTFAIETMRPHYIAVNVQVQAGYLKFNLKINQDELGPHPSAVQGRHNVPMHWPSVLCPLCEQPWRCATLWRGQAAV